jgi:hypothetical protein
MVDIPRADRINLVITVHKDTKGQKVTIHTMAIKKVIVVIKTRINIKDITDQMPDSLKATSKADSTTVENSMGQKGLNMQNTVKRAAIKKGTQPKDSTILITRTNIVSRRSSTMTTIPVGTIVNMEITGHTIRITGAKNITENITTAIGKRIITANMATTRKDTTMTSTKVIKDSTENRGIMDITSTTVKKGTTIKNQLTAEEDTAVEVMAEADHMKEEIDSMIVVVVMMTEDMTTDVAVVAVMMTEDLMTIDMTIEAETDMMTEEADIELKNHHSFDRIVI